MRHRSAATVVALLAAVPGSAILNPGDATAATSDSCTVRVPARITVNAPTERVSARLESDCARAGVTYASWNVVNRAFGLQDVLILDRGRTTTTWRFSDWQSKGISDVVPSIALDSASGRVRQNRTRTEIRYAARVSLAARRQGAVVTLRAHATRYTSATSGFGPIRGRRAFFATRSCRTCAWHRIGAVVTGKRGKAVLRVRAPRVRDYRAVMRGTSSVWGHTSRTSRS